MLKVLGFTALIHFPVTLCARVGSGIIDESSRDGGRVNKPDSDACCWKKFRGRPGRPADSGRAYPLLELPFCENGDFEYCDDDDTDDGIHNGDCRHDDFQHRKDYSEKYVAKIVEKHRFYNRCAHLCQDWPQDDMFGKNHKKPKIVDIKDWIPESAIISSWSSPPSKNKSKRLEAYSVFKVDCHTGRRLALVSHAVHNRSGQRKHRHGKNRIRRA